jgi:hypothetical protein
MAGSNDNAWYAEPPWGWGVGIPIAWQGWLLSAVQLVGAVWGMFAFAGDENAQLLALLLVILIPFPLMLAKTRGR